MRIDRLTIINFRNYEKRRFELTDGINVIIGPNGSGKTNLLEAVHFASTTASHRTSANRLLVRSGMKACRVRASVSCSAGSFEVELTYEKNRGTSARINGSPVRSGTLLENFPVVMFSPEDIEVIKGSPSGLRRMMNISICQLSSGYIELLLKYRRVLRERNFILKKEGASGTLGTWTDLLRKYGAAITCERENFTELLNRTISAVSGEMGVRDAYSAAYRPSRYSAAAAGRDSEAGFTTWGPHRDGLVFLMDGKDIRDTGSRGQLRMAAIMYRVSNWRMLRDTSGHVPVFMMDDAFSELDARKRRLIADSTGAEQTLLTSAELPGELGKDACVIAI